ncbi:MAG: hypothetical protein HW420_380, partial [Candidatus Nitrosotenuis sp.]|nr:hypothetical protein [Candidatus Nitrosotenuis sp.]
MALANKIIVFLTILVLISGAFTTSLPFAFADSDDDQHDGNPAKKNRVWTGDGPPPPKLGKVGDLYIDNL